MCRSAPVQIGGPVAHVVAQLRCLRTSRRATSDYVLTRWRRLIRQRQSESSPTSASPRTTMMANAECTHVQCETSSRRLGSLRQHHHRNRRTRRDVSFVVVVVQWRNSWRKSRGKTAWPRSELPVLGGDQAEVRPTVAA